MRWAAFCCRCTGYAKIIDAVMDAGRSVADSADAGRRRGLRRPWMAFDGAKVDTSERFGADSWPDGARLVRAIRARIILAVAPGDLDG